jgi:hypothetical protein
MKVIFTDQSYESLHESSLFLLEEQGWSLEKVLELRNVLLDKADKLVTTYDHYQQEGCLIHLGKGHKRTIEGYFKIIYKIEGEFIYVTDFFDSRQDPSKMKG